jgi:DNA invertase Pin-like site-specific DNA recombinase
MVDATRIPRSHADEAARTPKRVGIYCRLSYAPDGSIEKVERQEGDCRDLAGRLGWPVSEQHIFRDNSRSAWQRNRKRPRWDAMLAAIEAGEIDAIIVYHGDRLIRQPYDLERLIGIADSKGVRVASPSGTRDLDSPDDRFILRIEAAQACRESDNISRRVKRGFAARAIQGRTASGGRRPFGFGVPTGETRERTDQQTGEVRQVPVYDTDQQVPEEARLLAQAAERLLAGQTQAGVVRWLNEEAKSQTTEGNPWMVKTLRNLMMSPRIAGLIEHDGDLYEAVWDEIIDRETWEDLLALYKSSSEAHLYQGRERRHLLSGIAECVTCDSTVRVKPSGGRNRKTSRLYHCWAPGCPRRVSRNQEHLDRYIEGRVLRLLSDKRFIAELHADDEQPGVAGEIAALERRKRESQEQLENLADHEAVDPVLVARSLASFDRKIVALRAQVATSARRRLLLRMVGMGREAWDAEPIDVRAATVQALFRVVILPATWRGPGFDPASVKVLRRSASGGE